MEKGTLKILDKEETILVNFKLSRKEKAQMKKKAKRYCKGNLSMWFRYACINMVPSESELS